MKLTCTHIRGGYRDTMIERRRKKGWKRAYGFKPIVNFCLVTCPAMLTRPLPSYVDIAILSVEIKRSRNTIGKWMIVIYFFAGNKPHTLSHGKKKKKKKKKGKNDNAIDVEQLDDLFESSFTNRWILMCIMCIVKRDVTPSLSRNEINS